MDISFNFIKNCNVHFMRLARCPSTVKVNLQIQLYSLRLQNFNRLNRCYFIPAYTIEFQLDKQDGKK